MATRPNKIKVWESDPAKRKVKDRKFFASLFGPNGKHLMTSEAFPDRRNARNNARAVARGSNAVILDVPDVETHATIGRAAGTVIS